MNAATLSPVRDDARQQSAELARRLRDATRGDVLFSAGDRARYATDASIYQITPVGVLVPREVQDAITAIEISRELGVPLLPRGAGSSQCGQTVGAALVIDSSKHLNAILDFDADARTVTVEPGIALDALNAWLKPHGLWYPVDVSTAAQATLGGMAGNNSCGSRSIAYGNMVHNVLGIRAVLADGTDAWFGPEAESVAADPRLRALASRLRAIAEAERDEIEARVPQVMRRVGGYNIDIYHPQSVRPYTQDGHVNLAHMLVGSEGTLAWFRELKLQLAPLPRERTLGVVNFDSFYKAMDSAQHIVTLDPSAVELVDSTMIALAQGNPSFRPVIERALRGKPEALLLVEFAGESRDEQLARLAGLVTLMADLGLPGSVVEMPEAAEQAALWNVRKAGLNIMMSMKGNGKPVSFIEDCAVPLEHLAEYTRQLTEVFHKHDTEGTWYAHASVGTLHVRPILDMRAGDASKMRAIAEEASALVRKYKGAFSGEHGDGLVRSEWVAWQFGPRLGRAFEAIKDSFDPEGLMNPGKIVRSTRMDDTSLYRFPPGYETARIRPALDWQAWNVTRHPRTGAQSAPGTGNDGALGFGMAVEMCNNNGHCRKFDAGTMCPSYRVTRDERHSTRGRANTLRMALSGQLGPDALASDEMRATMDLCVSCKGCRRECPTGVDMARMKIEFLHAWKEKHGLRFKERLIATMPVWAPWAARLPLLFNLRDRIPGLAKLSERLWDFTAKRSLPVWRRDTFLGKATGVSADEADVVLFVDTFNNYFEAENARAALAVLKAAGYRVHIARPQSLAGGRNGKGERPLCCGRTWLSAGMVDEARAEAQRVLDAMAPFIERGLPIVGLEPSCLLSFRDEFQSMGLGDAAKALSRQSFLFEEFLVREQREGRLKLPLKPLAEKQAWVHGHCHQKSFDAFTPVQTVLGWIPELELKVVQSSCCGMAGSFGYDAAHYETSMAMAELSLLPALREAPADALVVADGTSCRQQITHGLEDKAPRPEHLACVLERALAG
ncbi:MAG: FAD-binding and (Fe-S)-binding domain-containing protein [Castellaniella sp.]